MEWKAFFSTFLLIFLAELGDKTQLTALAQSAAHNRWIVFGGASLALVLSTLLAVLFGDALTKFFPPKILHIACALLFFTFGAFLLIGAFKNPV